MEFSQPRVYHNCSKEDLVRSADRIYMILSSAPYRRIGCLLADSGTIRRELLDQLRDALVCFRIRSMRKHPEIFGDVSVNHSRTER